MAMTIPWPIYMLSNKEFKMAQIHAQAWALESAEAAMTQWTGEQVPAKLSVELTMLHRPRKRSQWIT